MFFIQVPPSQVVLNALRKTDNEPTNISCHASGIFPLPLVTLVWTEKYDFQNENSYSQKFILVQQYLPLTMLNISQTL